MKTRIISGAVGIALLIAVIAIGVRNAAVMCGAMALLTAIGSYEMLRNTSFVKCPAVLIAALAYSLAAPFFIGGIVNFTGGYVILIYYLVLTFLTIVFHREVDALTLFSAAAVPVLLSICFTSLFKLFAVHGAKQFYFVLALVFAWGCDTAAYFGGMFFGKHKLAPEISPKKTVEGAACGILGSVLLSLLVCAFYQSTVKVNYGAVVLAAVIFSVVGMMGDLLTSQIKRGCEIKDFGNIMPGHGGVMDRFDSVLLIAPCFLSYLIIAKII